MVPSGEFVVANRWTTVLCNLWVALTFVG